MHKTHPDSWSPCPHQRTLQLPQLTPRSEAPENSPLVRELDRGDLNEAGEITLHSWLFGTAQGYIRPTSCSQQVHKLTQDRASPKVLSFLPTSDCVKSEATWIFTDLGKHFD